MPLLVLDLGTKKIGRCLFSLPEGSPVPPPLPVKVTFPPTVEIPDAFDPRTVARALLADLIPLRVSELLVELAPLYMPGKGGKIPSAQARQIAANHELLVRLVDRLADGCAELGIAFHDPIARSTWAGRISKGQSAGKGNRLTNQEARRLVPAYLDPSGELPADEHQNDAAGALLGHLCPQGVGIAPRPPKPPRPNPNGSSEAFFLHVPSMVSPMSRPIARAGLALGGAIAVSASTSRGRGRATRPSAS